MSAFESSTFVPLPILGQEPAAPKTDYAAIRRRLEQGTGREYWRSMGELGQTAEFQDFVKHEFPRDTELWMDDISRRDFLKLMGSGLALAFFSACRKPLEMIVPYNQAPEKTIPGKALFFASALPFQGYARGVLVENHMGRPTKIEGNPEHPDSLGATDVFMQAAVLSFYDPDRSQVVTHDGQIGTWDAFLNQARAELGRQHSSRGAGIRLLTETITSPSLAAQIRDFLKRFPEAVWTTFEPCARDAARAGAHLAFGEDVETRYRFDLAQAIVALDADFLSEMPGSLNYTRAFADRRRVQNQQGMNRLYAAEPTPTITGTMADHRLPVRSDRVAALTRELARRVGAGGGRSAETLSPAETEWVHGAARDLQRNTRQGIVIPGDSQPAYVHALAHAMNHVLGNAGRTVLYTEPVTAQPAGSPAITDLAREMRNGDVRLLLVLGGDPAYNAPADSGFAEALARVPLRAHLSLYEDETSALCNWHLPEAHPLEAWGDLRAFDGTVSVIQPQVEPLYAGKTAGELLSALVENSPQTAHELVQGYWKSRSKVLDFAAFWKKTLHDGIMAGTAFAARPVYLKPLSHTSPAPSQGLEIVFKPDPKVWDGRYANNGWLQELPHPITKLTWDNAVLIAPALAERLGVDTGDVVELGLDGKTVRGPVSVLPGQADQTVTVALGYGRTRAGRIGNGAGFNIFPLRRANTLNHAPGLSIRRTGARATLATTQHHFAMEGRDLIRVGTLAEYERNPRFAQTAKEPEPKETLYNYSQPAPSEENAWGMAIDLNMCTGCNACVIACQAENNIPIVGKEQVAKGREMHWIRIDRYNAGPLDQPKSYNQPVPCMHCEDAPCEVVCPVGATQHSDEGLNEMVYNRCVGTRYCSNNCPYKVRRFNFLNYTQEVKGPLELLQNPDVTVRSRGVMEKCTYCVQRIQQVKIQAGNEGRAIIDGEIAPACVQSCPTRAIVFGNLKDKKSAVSKMKQDPRDYALLAELGTRPRTTYQAKLCNPNSEINENG